jgi:multiple antibiotic resistance protein
VIETLKNIFLIVSALFPIVNPLGGSPIFLSLTREYDTSGRRALSWRIAINSFFLLVGSYFIGTHILSFFGISIPVVQVGGGLIVISTGWAMLKQRDEQERNEVHRHVQPQDEFSQAFYPLTLPLTVGPGSISIAITLGAMPHILPDSIFSPSWQRSSGRRSSRSPFSSATDSRSGWRKSWERQR